MKPLFAVWKILVSNWLCVLTREEILTHGTEKKIGRISHNNGFFLSHHSFLLKKKRHFISYRLKNVSHIYFFNIVQYAYIFSFFFSLTCIKTLLSFIDKRKVNSYDINTKRIWYSSNQYFVISCEGYGIRRLRELLLHSSIRLLMTIPPNFDVLFCKGGSLTVYQLLTSLRF